MPNLSVRGFMKRFLIFTIFILMTLHFCIAYEIVQPGVIPGDLLYGLDRAWEKFRLLLAVDPVEKVHLRVMFYQERMAELMKCVETNRTQFLDILLKEISEETSSIVTLLNKLELQGRDVSLHNEMLLNLTYSNILTLSNIFPNVSTKVGNRIEYLLNITEKVHGTCWERIKDKDPLKAARLMMSFSRETVRQFQTKTSTRAMKILLKLYQEEIVSAQEAIERAKYLGLATTNITEEVLNLTYSNILTLTNLIRSMNDGTIEYAQLALDITQTAHERIAIEMLDKIQKMIENGGKMRCKVDVDCKGLQCPVVIGLDKQVCYQGFCFCGSRHYRGYVIHLFRNRERLKSLLQFSIRREISRMKEG